MVSTSIGFNFSASSVVKKACLVAINVLLMILGIAVAVLSLYQVKLMPESYDLVTSRYNEARAATTAHPTTESLLAGPGNFNKDGTTKKKRSSDFVLSTTSAIGELMLTTSLQMSTEAVTISPAIRDGKLETDFTMSPDPTNLSSQEKFTTDSLEGNLVKVPTIAELVSPNVVSMMTTEISQVTFTTMKSVQSSSSSSPLTSTQSTLANFNKLFRFLEENLGIERKGTTKSPTPVDSAQAVDGATRNKRSPSTTPNYSTPFPGRLPQYFEEIFNLVQTSLYVSIGAGLIIFLSALLGVCGGVCRVPLCLKLGVCGISLVMILEMATAAFIFLSHDKVKNRNKHKDFDSVIQRLCDDANFCVNPMMLVLVGSFLCIAIIFQVGSITISCKLINDQVDEYFVGDGNMCGVATEHRRFLRNWRGPMPGPSMPMFPSNCGGLYSCGMMTGGMGQCPSIMPMQHFPAYPSMPQAPFYYPPNGGSRPTVNLAFVS